MQQHPLALPGNGAPRVAGTLDQALNHWYVSAATEDVPTPHLKMYNAHDLSEITSFPITKGSILSLEWAHNTLFAIGMNETVHYDDGVPTIMRVDLGGGHLITICQGRDDLTYQHTGKASTIDESVWLYHAMFYDLYTAHLDPWLVTCDLRSGSSSYVPLRSQVQAMLAIPVAFFGNNTKVIPQWQIGAAQGVLIGVNMQNIVSIDPRSGLYTTIARLPDQPIYPSLSLGPNKQVYCAYGDTAKKVRSLVTINVATGVVSTPVSHANLTDEDLESAVFDSNP